MDHPKILASLRSADLSHLDEELERLEAAGVDAYHLDVMDGKFVAEECFPPSFVRELRPRTGLPLDVHLLTESPETRIDDYVAAGADRIAFHAEAATDAPACIARIRAGGAQPGIVLLPGTELESIRAFLGDLDFVNPLGVDPTRGLGFQEETYARIETLCAWRRADGHEFAVQADGGVWEQTREGLRRAGADELVGGYPIFSADDYAAAVGALRQG